MPSPGRRFASDALLVNMEPWDGPVVRLADLSPDERVALGLAPVETRRSEIGLRLCQNPHCRHWTGSAVRCVVCHT